MDAFIKLKDQVERSLQSGDSLLAGQMAEEGFSSPLLIHARDSNSCLMREEVFALVFVVCSYSHDNEMIAQVNDNKFGLGFTIFDDNVNKVDKLSSKIQVG